MQQVASPPYPIPKWAFPQLLVSDPELAFNYKMVFKPRSQSIPRIWILDLAKSLRDTGPKCNVSLPFPLKISRNLPLPEAMASMPR